ncbi:MAG TPA: hypothetical protein PK228_09825 [Saprospiraceae bacterium]|nr:hypothetical protein [Saprospiraceae bacterium]
MTTAPDRLQLLLNQNTVTGIDYIDIHADQITLDIYFFVPPAGLASPLALTSEKIRIYCPTGAAPDMPVDSMNWTYAGGRQVLRLKVAQPGDFTLYKIRLDDSLVDLFYNDVTFSFKANCPSDLDCEPPEHECPPETPVDFQVDYLARDFWSFRRALLDFASQRYPDWPDRLEADAGVMLAEVMSALGDEMAYYQDRIGREAYLETTTQRRSMRYHARLVDYHIHDGAGATAWLDVTVNTGSSGNIPAGINVWASGDSGLRVDFEVGKGLEEILAGKTYFVDASRNSFQAHIWDENQLCLPVGCTEMYIDGHQENILKPFDDSLDTLPGKWVLLQTMPANPAQAARAHTVRLIKITNTDDPVLNVPVTHLMWEQAQGLPYEMDMAVLSVRANLVPITAGKTGTMYFITGADLTELTTAEQSTLNAAALNSVSPEVNRALEREGRDGSVRYLFSLPESEQRPLVWLGDNPRPEIQLSRVELDSTTNCWNPEESWSWRRSLLDAQGEDRDYTLDDGSWRRVVGYQRIGEEFVHRDYASGQGVTICFGDGEFGFLPGERSVFRVDYRLGGGNASNVSPDTLVYFDNHLPPVQCGQIPPDLSFIKSVTNPVQGRGGRDPETPSEVRQLAPDAFRAVTYRAVRPEDYAEAAERLPWVQRAGAAFRWTGSWLSAFVTPDPRNAVVLEETQRIDLVRQLDRFRQAGREAWVSDPVYADLDMEIEICAAPGVYRAEVKERLLEVLFGKKGVRPQVGYFSADRFTFGFPLERSTLEKVIQDTPGVRAVEGIRFRRRGWFNWKVFTEMYYDPGQSAIIRVENDPLNPERGTLKLNIHGGA